MNRNRRRLYLDTLAVRYLEATERADWNTLADLWSAAESDPELEALLHELNAELAKPPVVRRRRIWIALATGAAAACVAALIWLATMNQGPQKKLDTPRPIVASKHPPSNPGPGATATVILAPRNSLFRGDLEGVQIPAFAWPFSDKPIIKGSSPIPADLLN